jgi:hypothetical protein
VVRAQVLPPHSRLISTTVPLIHSLTPPFNFSSGPSTIGGAAAKSHAEQMQGFRAGGINHMQQMIMHGGPQAAEFHEAEAMAAAFHGDMEAGAAMGMGGPMFPMMGHGGAFEGPMMGNPMMHQAWAEEMMMQEAAMRSQHMMMQHSSAGPADLEAAFSGVSLNTNGANWGNEFAAGRGGGTPMAQQQMAQQQMAQQQMMINGPMAMRGGMHMPMGGMGLGRMGRMGMGYAGGMGGMGMGMFRGGMGGMGMGGMGGMGMQQGIAVGEKVAQGRDVGADVARQQEAAAPPEVRRSSSYMSVCLRVLA